MTDTGRDVVEQALRRALASDAPAAEWFAPNFLRRYPHRIVRQIVRSFLDRHGSLVAVEEDGERWWAVYERDRVGNSGSSTEPHLHVHAERDRVAVPLLFRAARRRPLRRNDVVRVRAERGG